MVTKNPTDLNIPQMAAVDLWDIWNNVVVFTTWEEAVLVQDLCTNSKKVFYIYDLDWHESGLDYDEQIGILNKMDRILCRSKDHKIMIENYYDISVEVMPFYDYKTLMET